MALEKHLTIRVVPDWRQWLPSNHSKGARFAELARAVEYRNTSKPGDEMLYMASILGLSTKRILQEDTAKKKTMAFYLTLKMVPISILFCAGLRIRDSGFRRAPSSLITSENSRKLNALSKRTEHFGRCEENGLHINASGILFTIKLGRDLDFNRVWINPDKVILEPSTWEASYKVPEWQGWSRLRKACTNREQLALIINPQCDHEGVVLRTLEGFERKSWRMSDQFAEKRRQDIIGCSHTMRTRKTKSKGMINMKRIGDLVCGTGRVQKNFPGATARIVTNKDWCPKMRGYGSMQQARSARVITRNGL
jgi:hypothetical protein